MAPSSLHRPRRTGALRCTAWACGLLLGGMAAAGAQTARLGFDDLPDGTELAGHYRAQGLTLGCIQKPNLSQCRNAAVVARPGPGQGPARSGAQVLTVAPAGPAPWPAFDERNGYLHLRFKAPVQTVTVQVKPHQPHAGASGNRPFIQAFGAGNQWLATVDYSGPVGSGADWQALTVSRPQADIQYLLVSSYANRGGEQVLVLVDDLSYAPMPVAAWTAVAAGQGQSLGLREDGSLWAWGANGQGQLGLGDTRGRDRPVKLPGQDWAAVAAGLQHVLALKTDGSLWAWGQNLAGQLGDGSNTPRHAPVRVGQAQDWTAVAAGADHALGIRRETVQAGDRHSLWAWGGNAWGQLGDGSRVGRNEPTPVPGMLQVRAVAAGEAFSLVQDLYGQVQAWGYNGFGQLGQGDLLPRPAPVNVPVWGALALGNAGSGHVALLDSSNNRLHTWGLNDRGQLGHGHQAPVTQPQPLIGAWRANAAAGGWHTVALQDGGSLWAWGRNHEGQLGDGSLIDRHTPTRIGADSAWAQVAAGFAHTLAIRRDGSLWAWGRNADGQLGLSGTVAQNRPQPVAGLQVQASAGTRGRIQPAGMVAAVYGESLAFQLQPEPGYTAVASGCGGQLQGLTYTTAAMVADCVVQARFDGPRANLVPGRLQLPAQAAGGQVLALLTSISNSGSLSAPASVACVDLASARLPLARPRALGCVPVGALAPGARQLLRHSITLPAGLAAGDWRIGLRVDGRQQVDESNEDDNRVTATVRVLR